VALKVLLDEKHVTRAAAKLNLTQSAVSRTLAKLRSQFNDALLVKSGQHLARTAKAERLYQPLDQIIKQITHLIEPEIFTPATTSGSIRIASTDYIILLPKHFVRRYVDPGVFASIAAPFTTPHFEISIFWHARIHHDPLHVWFRDFIYQNIYEKRRQTAVIR
jgi:DNA-binding transcriptional LysR family regulator